MCPKTGVPLNVLGKPGLTKKFLDQLDQQTEGTKKNCVETQSIISTLSTISIRPKDETPEQRTERKRLVKEYRQVISDKCFVCQFSLLMFEFYIFLTGKKKGKESQLVSFQRRKETTRKTTYKQP